MTKTMKSYRLSKKTLEILKDLKTKNQGISETEIIENAIEITGMIDETWNTTNRLNREVSSQLSENDKKLIKDFHIDFDSILKKCIEGGQAEVWFTSSLTKKVDSLYKDKWKEQISRIENIALQSDILSTISTLQDFCKALDPDIETSVEASVRRLRIKLRDNYIKLHPESYAGLFPNDAFIDDWNDEN